MAVTCESCALNNRARQMLRLLGIRITGIFSIWQALCRLMISFHSYVNYPRIKYLFISRFKRGRIHTKCNMLSSWISTRLLYSQMLVNKGLMLREVFSHHFIFVWTPKRLSTQHGTENQMYHLTASLEYCTLQFMLSVSHWARLWGYGDTFDEHKVPEWSQNFLL